MKFHGCDMNKYKFMKAYPWCELLDLNEVERQYMALSGSGWTLGNCERFADPTETRYDGNRVAWEGCDAALAWQQRPWKRD